MNGSKLLPLIGVALLMATGCDRNPKSLSQLGEVSTTDSLMYLKGQINAGEYWHEAVNDTLLRSDQAREDFMKGVEAGMKAVRSSDPYNSGVFLGVQIAMDLRDFKERYGMTPDADMVMTGMEYGLQSDTSVNQAQTQADFYRILDRLQRTKLEKDSERAIKALASAANERKMTRINESLYGIDITPADGAKVKIGDRVGLKISASTLSGRMIGRSFPEVATLGEGKLRDDLRMAVLSCADGQTRQFLTTPMALLGHRYENYGLGAEEPVLFTVHVALLAHIEIPRDTVAEASPRI